MKPLFSLISAITIAGLLPAAAQTTTTEKSVTRNPDGSTTTVETTTFTPEYRTKVVKYFDAYKEEQYGLPPGWSARIRTKEIPAAWRTTVAPGVVITEAERPYLMDAPSELVAVLPKPRGEVRYYVAGSNVVAVDPEYRIIDSIQIPSVRFSVE